MTAVHKLLGPVCISEPSICLYVGGKMATEESQFEEDTLFGLLYRWSNSPTTASWGSITDAYWICMAWLKVFDKENSVCQVPNDEPSVGFTRKVQHFTKQFGTVDLDETQNVPLAALLSEIEHLKDSYKSIVGAI